VAHDVERILADIDADTAIAVLSFWDMACSLCWQVRDSGQRVVIDGPCFSACTLALAVIPRSRICVTPNAVLGFHAAWTTDTYGHTVASPAGTRLVMESYPAQIKSWIARQGGLNGNTIHLRGRELAAIYRRCR
jgi:hypothetical protein